MRKKMTVDRFVEQYGPYVLALVPAIAALAMPKAFILHAEVNLSNPLMTVMAILLAFTATSMTIVLAENGAPGIQKLKEHPEQYRYFIQYHVESIATGILACVLCLIAVLLSKAPVALWHVIFFALWVAGVFAAFTTFLRIVRLLNLFLLRSI